MTAEPLLRKIRSLIAKAESTDSEHEAAALMAKVRELMDQHQLSMLDVTQQNQQDPLGRTTLDMPYRNGEYAALADAAARFLGCVTVTWLDYNTDWKRVRRVEFLGREGARASALEMVPYLFVSCRKEAARIMREEPGRHHSRSHLVHQVMTALTRRLARLSFQQPATSPIPGALVPVPEADSFKDEVYGEIPEHRPHATSPTASAREAADRISLVGQVREQTDSTRLLA